MFKNSNHDLLIKKVMQDDLVAKEFLSEYLPSKYLEILDLNKIIVEKESYVEENLKPRFSDMVFSVKLKNDIKNKGFVYVLLEHQSTSDYLIAFRLLKYTILLLERHVSKKNKLPIVLPMVIYNGSTKYTAPRNIFELFLDPVLAKQAFTQDYVLIDLEAIKDDGINYEKYTSMFLYMMKHIHERDILQHLERCVKLCYKALDTDKNKDYFIFSSVLQYTARKIKNNEQGKFEKLISETTQEKAEDIMRSIVDVWREEGIKEGREEGREEGIKLEKINVVKNMLCQNIEPSVISSVTGISIDEIEKLKN